MNAGPGRLIASGRSADIFDAGAGRVVRRRRSGPIPAHEIAAMTAARSSGYPVPEVFAVDGPAMEMERVDGTDLMTDLSRRPWRVLGVAAMLAELQLRLREVPIDALEIRRLDGPPEALVHGDLHPGNVVLTDGGPIVIDWESAAVGPCDVDAATVWLLLSVADADDVPRLLRPAVPVLRRVLLRRFVALVGRPRPASVVLVCRDRLADPNMRPREREAIRRFLDRHGGGRATARR